jgi:hypothetical protein
MKKPSEPSLITSAISCMFLGPESFIKISQRIQRLTPRNTIDIINAEKEIKLDVDCDTNM